MSGFRHDWQREIPARQRAPILRYGLAALYVVIAIGVRLLLEPLLGIGYPFITLLLAVVAAAWYGGLGPAVAAVVLGALGADYFLLDPRGGILQSGMNEWVGIGLFACSGLGVGLLGASMHDARERAEATARELSASVRERTAALARSEARMAGIVGSAMDAIISIDGGQEIVLFNLAAEKLFQCTAAEAIGQPLDRFIPALSRDYVGGFAATDETSRSTDSPGALTGLRADGEEFPIEASISPIHVEGEQFHTVILRDITERRRAEAALRASESSLAAAQALAHLGSWELDLETLEGFWSAEMSRLLGRDPSLPAPGFEEFLGMIHPEDHRHVLELQARTEKGDTPITLEYRTDPARGPVRILHASIHVVHDATGRPVRTLGTTLDITERKKQEERSSWLASFPERNPNPILEVHLADGVIHYANPAARRLFPHPPDAGLDHPLLAGLPELAGRLAASGTLRREVAAGGFYFSQVLSELAEVGRIRVYSMDITERRDTERALREKDMQLHAADRRLAEIVNGMTEACFALDADWRFTFVNGRGEALLHHRREEMIGRSMWEVFDKLVGTPMEAHYRRAMAERVPVAFEAFSPIAERWLDIRLFPTAEGLAAFLLDIDSRKKAESAIRENEERLQAVTENLSEGLIVSDLDGQLLHWNRAGLEMCGYHSLEEGLRKLPEFAGTFVHASLAGEVFEFERWPLNRVLHGETLRDVEMCVRRRDMDWERIFSYSGAIVHDASGKPLAYLAINDITASKQAEAALRESEDRFRTMANSMSQLAWMAHADGIIFWYNQRWYEYTGKTAEEMENSDGQDLHDPEVLPKVMENWRTAIDSGQPFEMEFPLCGADGSFRMFLTRALPMRNSRGEIVQWFGTNTDVDELKRMAESLRETQSRLNSTLAAGSIGTWTWDIINDSLVGDGFTAHVFGIDAAAAARGLPAAAYLQAVFEEDQPTVSAALAEAIRTCGEYDIEYRVGQGDGTFLWLQARGRVEGDAAGNPVNFHGAVMDITARKLADAVIRESEEHFRFLNDLSEATRVLADPTEIMVVMTRMLGEHLLASRCAYADVEPDGERFIILHDYTDGCASTVGRYQLSLFGPQAVTALHAGQTLIIRSVDEELAADEGADMFRSIGIQAIITCPLVKHGGLRAMVAVHQTTRRDWRPGEVAIVRDVVERCWAAIERRNSEEKIHLLNTELEQRVIDRTAQLEAANKELEAFSYSVSHDLRAPLRAVDGFSQALLEDYVTLMPEEGRRYLQTIRQGAQKMGMLIDDLLTFSRLSRLPLRRQPVDTDSLVRSVLEDLMGAEKGRQIELRIGGLPVCAGDPALLRQVWVNLISNALKYTRKREFARIEIGCDQGAEGLVYFIRDNGTGFDMRYAGKLFGVFQRLHRAEDYEGTGVGLAIVQRVVHRHGGRVWAEATLDQGAAFYFSLEGQPNHEHELIR